MLRTLILPAVEPPYLVVEIVAALYHLTVLPADLPEDDLNAAPRRCGNEVCSRPPTSWLATSPRAGGRQHRTSFRGSPVGSRVACRWGWSCAPTVASGRGSVSTRARSSTGRSCGCAAGARIGIAAQQAGRRSTTFGSTPTTTT